jgi:hypothetical protein
MNIGRKALVPGMQQMYPWRATCSEKPLSSFGNCLFLNIKGPDFSGIAH